MGWRWWLAPAVMVAATPVAADVDEDLAARGWHEITFSGKTPNRFGATAEGVSVRGNGSVSMLFTSATVDLAATPVLTWTWCVAAGPPPTDITRKGGDDRALAIFVGFGHSRGLRALIARLRFGDGTVPERALAYVRGAATPAGAWFPSPQLGEGSQVTVVAPQAEGGCREERRDVVADYRAAFGSDPLPVTQLAISSDSDDTSSTVQAEVRGLRFGQHGL